VFSVNGLGSGGNGRSCVVDPTGTVVHQAAGHEEVFPIEVDLDLVRRQRETGLRGLGQVLKSFRDRSVDFPVYDRASGSDAYLRGLGPLDVPQQGNRDGIGVAAPATGGQLPATPPLVLSRPLPAHDEHEDTPRLVGRTITG
jgi:hypothetical protein